MAGTSPAMTKGCVNPRGIHTSRCIEHLKGRGKMKPDSPSSGIDRRAMVSTLALLPLSATLLPASAQAQVTGVLPSWNDGATKQAILDFVRATTDRSSPDYVAPEERVATFDQDGT